MGPAGQGSAERVGFVPFSLIKQAKDGGRTCCNLFPRGPYCM